jgi:hypothetical protein
MGRCARRKEVGRRKGEGKRSGQSAAIRFPLLRREANEILAPSGEGGQQQFHDFRREPGIGQPDRRD